MGATPGKMEDGKVDAPENPYLDKALQIKDSLDSLAIYAQSLVQNLDSQTSSVTGLQRELQRLKSEVPLAGSRENTDSQMADQRQLPFTSDSSVRFETEVCGDGGEYRSNIDTQYDKHTKRPKSGSKTGQTPDIHTTIQKGSSSVDRELLAGNSNDGKQRHQQYSNRKDCNKASGSPRSVVRREDAVHSPMEVDQCHRGASSYTSNQSVSVAVVESGIPNFLEAVVKNQDSVMLQAVGILNTVQNLQHRVTKEIPPEVRQRHGRSVNSKKFVFNVNLHTEKSTRPMTSELSIEEETQTDMDRSHMEQILKDNKHLTSLNESNERMLKNRGAEIEKLKRDLANIKERNSPSQNQYSGYTPFWTASPKPPRRKASVQTYCSRRSDKTDAVNAELDAMLKTQFDLLDYDLTCTSCDRRDQLSAGIPVIVLCINASRLGTDVQTSLEGTTGMKKLAVIILHHKDTHALPKQPSRRILTGTEYKSLVLIDMAFLANKGVYPCDMNQNALSELVEFIMPKA